MGSGLLIGAISPAIVGGIAAVAGGDEGWRWVFIVLGLPALVIAGVRPADQGAAPRAVRDEGRARRGDRRPAHADVGGVGVLPPEADQDGAHGGARLRGHRLRPVHVADPAILYVEEEFGLDSLERGLLGSLGGLLVVVRAAVRRPGLRRPVPTGPGPGPAAGRAAARCRSPSPCRSSTRCRTRCCSPIVGVIPTVLLMTAFTMVGPVMQSVVPYRLRGMGAALASIYIFFIGATGGAVIASFFVDAIGPKASVLLLTVPSVAHRRAADHPQLDAHQERPVAGRRRAAGGDGRAQAPAGRPGRRSRPCRSTTSTSPTATCRCSSTSASRSARARCWPCSAPTAPASRRSCASSPASAPRPAAWFGYNGLTITYVSPEKRGRMGIRLLPGGKGVFPQMTVRENLEMAAFVYRQDRDDMERRIARVLELFTDLAGRQDQPAASLSGGQQQMLALAMRAAARARRPAHRRALARPVADHGRSSCSASSSGSRPRASRSSSSSSRSTSPWRSPTVPSSSRRARCASRATPASSLERDDLARAVFLGKDGGLSGARAVRAGSPGSSSSTASSTGWCSGCVAMGIVLIYRSTRVINFAVGNMGFVGAGLFALLVVQYGVPFWIAAVRRPARSACSTARSSSWRSSAGSSPHPGSSCWWPPSASPSCRWPSSPPSPRSTRPAPGSRRPSGPCTRSLEVRVAGPQLTILIVVPLLAVGLGWLLNRTALGKAVKASAENPDLARLSGISPKLVSTVRVGHRRRARHPVALSPRRTGRLGPEPRQPRTKHPRPGPGRRGDRRDGVVPAGVRRRRS